MPTPPTLLGGLRPDEFLKDYWQKKPLLIRGALPDFASVIAADELAGLACEEHVESRLVQERGERPWQLRRGPFAEEDFLALPATHWTLLVQEANKHLPELAELIGYFDFIPSCLLDDVMISFAPDQGTVGPHYDYYDVFLLQVEGQKRWRINTQPIVEDNYIPGIDLRIMKSFEAEHDWLLEPGDMLYLPPGVAHYGIALGESITYSVGYRALGHAELLASYLEDQIGKLPAHRYLDTAGLKRAPHSGEIDAEMIARVAHLIRTLPMTETAIARWFGGFITEPKGCAELLSHDHTLTPAQWLKQLKQGATLKRSEYSRFNFVRGANPEAWLYIDGEEYPTAAALAELLCDRHQFHWDDLAAMLADGSTADFLCALYNHGKLYFSDDLP